MSRLPINLEDLLRHRTVERDRIEYKAGWNPDAIVRTLCAFANDFENLGGGYIVIGQDCDGNGQPVLPPVGIRTTSGQDPTGTSRLLPLDPAAVLSRVSLEKFEGRKLIVLWAPGGQNRPYKAPKEVTAKHKTYHYYIRRYSSTVEAEGERQAELLSLTATVPFDDRLLPEGGIWRTCGCR